ncbi:MAG: hypothetical protein IJQ60_06080 [Prevotella sp.]|nr:hypothetical protein [Prevotella sp.]
MIVALLLMTTGIWGNNIVVVDGITNGTISANSSTASKDATVTLTVEPSEGYYITANDITIIKTGGGNMAQTRNDPNIADIFHPNASSIDAEGKGTYTFTMPVSDVKIEAVFRVRETVTGAIVNLSASSFTYNGNTQAPSVTSVTKGDITYLASESTNGFADYDVSIPNSINATESPFTVNVTFRGKYTGTASADYTINQATISHVDIAAISDQTYTGSPLKPEPVVKDLDISTTPLVKGKDYTVSYADDHTNVSDAVTVTITGMGNYDNNTTASTTFKIIAATLDATTLNNKIVLSSTSFEYTGEAQAPTVTITGMTEGTDYTVKYKNGNNQATAEKPKDAGTYTIVIVGVGNYSGEIVTSKTFTIAEEPQQEKDDQQEPAKEDDTSQQGSDGQSDPAKEDDTSQQGSDGQSDPAKEDDTSQQGSDGQSDPAKEDDTSQQGSDDQPDPAKEDDTSQQGSDDQLDPAKEEDKPQQEIINIDQSEPVIVDGEPLYELTEEVKESLKLTFDADIYLPSEANTRTTITEDGGLSFTKGSDVKMVIKNMVVNSTLKLVFNGNLFGDSRYITLKNTIGSSTRSEGDLEMVSGAEYDVIAAGDMVVVLKLGETAATISTVNVTAPSSAPTPPYTSIRSVESDTISSWFDLRGQKLSIKPTAKGVYILNGKKVVIK